MFEWVHPGWLLLAGSLLVPLLRGVVRQAYLLVLAGLALILVVTMDPGTYARVEFLGYELVFGRVDKLSLAFAWIFAMFGFLGFLFSLRIPQAGHHVAALWYVGTSLGITFAGDYLTLFIWWELQALSSVFLIWYEGREESLWAGFRYLLVHGLSGLLLVSGILLYTGGTGDLTFDRITEGGLGPALILLAFSINAAVVPLHAWLPDAYPEATYGGAVFLSAFTTKSAVYVLTRAFPGWEILMWAGAFIALYGVVFATMEKNLRRLLSYHIISQVGYMLCGVGIGTAMAISGAVAHAFNNILYKGLLFMGAGSILHMTGERRLSNMGGLYRHMPWTFVFYLVGALSISGFPLFNGFVSKSLVITAAAELHNPIIWTMLTMATTGTFLSVGLKPLYMAFFWRDSGLKAQDPPKNMWLAMAGASLLCIFIGIYPDSLYRLMPFPVDYEPYTATHVVWSLEQLLFTMVAFFLIFRVTEKDLKPSLNLDVDWFYRIPIRALMWFSSRPVAAWEERILGWAHITVVERATTAVARWCDVLDRRGVDALVDGLAWLVAGSAQVLRRMQTGLVPHYALYMAGGVALIVAVYLLV